MMSTELLAAASEQGDFPAWLRIAHYLNFLFMIFMIRSGIEILLSHPRLYWNNHCTPKSEWIKFTKKEVPTGPGVIYTAREDEVDASPWISMPGHKTIGLARGWHGVITTLWMLTGAVYLFLLFGTGEWERIVPTSWDIFGDAVDNLGTYLSLDAPPLSEFQPYDSLQQLAYFSVVFILGPLMILTGAAMSPAVGAAFPRFIKLFGGKQGARSIHFIVTVSISLFIIMHVTMVLLVHPRENLTNITLGGDPDRLGLAVTLVIVGVLVAFALNFWATWWSLTNRRAAQVATDKFIVPLQKAFLRPLKSKQRYSEADISPYHWVNGAPPKPEESPEFHRLMADGFRDWRLEIRGLVDKPVSLSLEDIKSLPPQIQITKHQCVQGWSGIAKWKGVLLKDVLEKAGVRPEGQYVNFVSHGLAQYSYQGKPLTPFYETLPMVTALDPQTILAYEMNDEPLPLRFGAPLRVRTETQVGYKMVKYLKAIEVIEDYSDMGDGQGGSREDTQFMGRSAEI